VRSFPGIHPLNQSRIVRQHPEDLIYCGHLRVLDINDSTGYDTQTAEAFLRSDGDLVRLLGCHILRLEHRKQMSGVQHEFIRLEMGANGLSEDRQYRRFIYVSRGISQEKRKARNSLKASSDRSSVVLSFDKTPLDTIDVFKLDDIDEDSLSWTLCTLDFSPYLTSPERATSSGGPTIIDVLCLAQTISEIAPQYKFYKYSCYWFARTFYDVFFLKFFLAHKLEDDKNFHLRGEWHGRRAVTDYGQLLLPPSTDRESRTAKQEDMLEGTTSNLTMTQNSPATDIPLASKPFVVKKAVKPDQDPAKQVAAEFDTRLKDALKDLQNPEINSHVRYYYFLLQFKC